MPKKKPVSALGVTASAIVPSLDALFASSSGPVKLPPKSSSASILPAENLALLPDSDDNELSHADTGLATHSEKQTPASSQNSDYDEDDDILENPQTTSDAAEAVEPEQPRKRKRKDVNDDLEEKYFATLIEHNVPEPPGKRPRGQKTNDEGDESGDEQLLVHESVTQNVKSLELEKADKTVFIGNVSTEAISSAQAKKTLVNHLTSVLRGQDGGIPQKLESIRFRSVAFSTASLPKKAAYITKSIMNATTKSANAYAVFSSPAAARMVASKLNGTEVLGRHIRVDSIAHPSQTDHRRCVFVGNLGFVDDETVVNTDDAGKTAEKKRNKAPSDVEEGLWRTFGKQGKVENVRVVRDTKTRVGKGFAYVQFYDANDVEAALLLDGKRFPPMLPRPLRVTRAKDPRKTAAALKKTKEKALSTPGRGSRLGAQDASGAGRAGKLLGRAGAALQRRDRAQSAMAGKKSPEQIVFEGKRASVNDGRPSGLKMGRKSLGRKAKPKNRSAIRAAEWRKKGAVKSS
ncbi:hypothetical protein L249_6736 [Ophiocordyceps polyrhachis-furcata BCC 54312]|uniref:Nucleolar protein 12 n=1 Tax=Ophiocordyceps polyrhachis-furcata BCC 54312 TaxID=1330021 RepID=A0A367LLS3_9HYPO|nr:hypothetical protein L249_6736 [Ophiocordyceps polyrhachis-furcata BCC 54312]